MIPVTAHIALDERDIAESFVRASGPGGQNVNKVSSAVQLRFNLHGFTELAPDVRMRAARLAGRRLTQDGIIVIQAQNHRTQERNREEALQRLIDLIAQAAIRPVIRRPTKPTKASQRRRMDTKTKRGDVKTLRGRVKDED